MRLAGPAVRLTILIDENDQWHHRPLYTEIVHQAHRHGLAGATAIRGIEGFTATSEIHAPHVFPLANHLPVAVVIVDSRERIQAFLDALDSLLTKGAVILDEVEVIRYVPVQPDRRRRR